jgi:RNA polymerase sigma factor (sigma-70 family)
VVSDAAAPADRTLVEGFLGGDEPSFRLLFRRHTPALLQFSARLLGGADPGAEDVVQEVWLRAATRLRDFAWRSSLRTWLTGIAVRCCYERLRSRRASAGDLAAEELAAPPAPDRAGLVDLERAVRALPDGYRTVLVLHELEGWSHEAIAAELHIQVSTSKSQLTRARRALRAYWEPQATGGGDRP